MKDIVDFLKKAVAHGPNVGVMGCYCFGNGSVSARNTALQAGVAMATPAVFNVPADEFELALGRMKEIQGLSFTGDSLVIKSGRLKATIQCFADDPPALPAMPESWQPVPEGFVEALSAALPFVGESGWNSGIRLVYERATAIKNTSGIDITIPGFDPPAAMNLPAAAAEFIISAGRPDEYTATADALMLRWADGRWCRAQLLADQWPDHIDTMFDKAGNEAPVEITADWRAAFDDAAAMSEGAVTVEPVTLSAGKGAGQVVIDVETPTLPEGFCFGFSPKVLTPILAVATHWAPAMCPTAVLFKGVNIRGIVMGVRGR